MSVADAEGLGAVSMGRVASELGSSPMSLYRYVGAKDELLALMVDAALGDPPPAPAGEGWRDGLARWAWTYHDALRRHPWALRVSLSAAAGDAEPDGVARGRAALARRHAAARRPRSSR